MRLSTMPRRNPQGVAANITLRDRIARAEDGTIHMLAVDDDCRAHLLSALHDALGRCAGEAAPNRPEFTGREREYVLDCIDSGWVSSAGKRVDCFEDMLAGITGAHHVIATVNGTAALHMALLVAGVRPGDEVLVPALSFVATANAVAHAGATPHFVDSDEASLGLDPRALAGHLERVAERGATGCRNRATGRRIAAVVPVHAFGYPADIEAIAEVAEKHGITVIEDAAAALGSRRAGRHVGTRGTAGILSFNGNKIVTTGGGGAILTNDEAFARHARHLTTTARVPHTRGFLHDEVGYNYRLPNLNAALGCAQLERLDDFLARRKRLAERYEQVFAGVHGMAVFHPAAACEANHWLINLRLSSRLAPQLEALLDAATDGGYACQAAWQLLSGLPMYRDCPQAPLPGASALAASLIGLPSHPGLCGTPT